MTGNSGGKLTKIRKTTEDSSDSTATVAPSFTFLSLLPRSFVTKCVQRKREILFLLHLKFASGFFSINTCDAYDRKNERSNNAFSLLFVSGVERKEADRKKRERHRMNRSELRRCEQKCKSVESKSTHRQTYSERSTVRVEKSNWHSSREEQLILRREKEAEGKYQSLIQGFPSFFSLRSLSFVIVSLVLSLLPFHSCPPSKQSQRNRLILRMKKEKNREKGESHFTLHKNPIQKQYKGIQGEE